MRKSTMVISMCGREQKFCTWYGKACAFVSPSPSVYQYYDHSRKALHFKTLSFDFHSFVSNLYMIGRTLDIKASFKHRNIRLNHEIL